jgi:hypothetical protein
MWSLLRVCPLSLSLASVGVLAQPAADPPSTDLPKAQLPNTEPKSALHQKRRYGPKVLIGVTSASAIGFD